MASIKDFSGLLWLVSGSIVVSVSSGIGLVSAFANDFVLTYICLMSIILSYKVMQKGIHGDMSEFSFSNSVGNIRLLDTFSLVGGSIIMVMSFLMLTESIVLLQVIKSVSAAVMMGAGYILTHWAVNNTLV